MAYESSMASLPEDDTYRFIPSAYSKQFRAMTFGVAIAFLVFAILLTISQYNQVHLVLLLPMLVSAILALYIINKRQNRANKAGQFGLSLGLSTRRDRSCFGLFLPYIDLAIVLSFLPYMSWLLIRAHRGQYAGYFRGGATIVPYVSALVILQACIHFLFVLDGFMAWLHRPKEEGDLCPHCNHPKSNRSGDNTARGRIPSHIKRDGIRYAILIPEDELGSNGLGEPSLEVFHDEEPTLLSTVDDHEAPARPQRTIARPTPPARNASLDTSAAYSQPSGRPSTETNLSLPAYRLE